MKSLNKTSVLFLFLPVVLFSACSNASDKPEEKINAGQHLVRITREQFNAEQMETGNTELHTFTHVYRTNGIVTAAPQSKADVYSYITGVIWSVSVNLGSEVKKGQELCTIESKQFISLQQQYLETLAKLKGTELDYNRVKKLYEENISSQKEFIAIESDYKILKATIEALRAVFSLLFVDIQNLEKGNILTHLIVRSPIDGIVAKQNVNLRQYVDSKDLLMTIINSRDLQLYFYVRK
jgi:cobalt-zinc-cadmium efflux system membrane fusion protein